MLSSGKKAWKCRSLIPYLSPSRGKDLFKNLDILQNAVILAQDGIIVEIGKNLSIPSDYETFDLGDALVCPPTANCHTHLQLSWLYGRTEWGHGFTTWLSSMLPQLLPVIKTGFGPSHAKAQNEALDRIIEAGTTTIGDVGGSLSGSLSAFMHSDEDIIHFCEWFGFSKSDQEPWPERCRAELAVQPELAFCCFPSGHSLYGTDILYLQRAHDYCAHTGGKFTFHLAESPEETEMLASGTGDLVEFYRELVLPQGWRPFGLSPFKAALKYGLLDGNTLAVHGVHLENDEIADFAATGAALCICARSNYNLGVGKAPVHKFIESGLLLCLGTDGLTSCEDVDVRNEAYYLQSEFDLPLEAALRMAIPNGRKALGLSPEAIKPGMRAKFSIWPYGRMKNAR